MSIFGGRKQDEPPAARREQKSSPPSPSAHHLSGFETVLGASTTLYGDLKCRADIRLDGIFEGTLEIDGNVLVGETAKITADIHGKNVSIAGAVRGNVSGKRVQLLRTGRVWGDISASAITTEEGAFIDGKIKMVSHEAGQDYDLSSLPLPDEIEPDQTGLPGAMPQEETSEVG
ncbi:MAG TPA: polymer-forming cytoskeletal protein [Aggregatilinea sp.]|uniref:bactofilin family protein n=1 Tax=Aggregatilinea sp. TaxID=2806333 RepID=UPI002D01126D|nr:polymer-forming cytoskeletal protein [Aggregatilinea sp.]HML24565.1 polymer-forming cytoskeletal protein [Aggregatilinea sp.]